MSSAAVSPPSVPPRAGARTTRGALAGAAALLALARPAAAAGALQDTTMAVPVAGLSFSLGYLADDLDLWAKHGLRVKTVEISGVGALNAVISGSVDFAEPSGLSLIRAAARGQPLLAIVETIDEPTVQIVLRTALAKAAGFDPAAPLAQRALALRGRTIAVDSIASLIHAYVRVIAARGGYDPEEVHIAVMQPPSMVAAFAAGSIDGFAMGPPWPLIPVQDGTGVTIASGPDGDPPGATPFAGTVVATLPATCTTRPSLCQGIGASFAEAAAFIADHPDEALGLLRKHFPTLDPKLLAAGFAVVRKITPRPPVPTAEALANAEQFNVDAGLMKPADKLKSYDALVTGAYVR